MGYKIKEWREKRKLTQEELSAKSGVSRTIISNLENDSNKSASTKTLVKIANALDTTVDKLFFS